jgi:YVTN family beta-propeller protein
MRYYLILTFFCVLAKESLSQKSTLIYTANQNSNTITIIDAEKESVLGTIVLGYPSIDPRILHPLYNGDINVHGINYDPVYGKVAVVSTVSNSVTLIDAASATVVGQTYVGRNPHEPRFTKNGAEIWVTVRGENYVVILDALSLKERSRIILTEGPGMVAFSKDGKVAYVCSSFDDNFWVIDTRSKKIIRTLKVPSRFSPFVNVTMDGKEVWVTHKDTGMITRIDARSYSVIESFVTGKITNHIAFSDKYIFVSVGGENKVKVYTISLGNKAALVSEIKSGELPHGIWYHLERDEVYLVCELENTLQIIDATALKVKVSIPIGERPQALIPMFIQCNPNGLTDSLSRHKVIFKGPQTK